MLYIIIIGIIAVVIIFKLLDGYGSNSADRLIEKERNKSINQSKHLLEQIGELEGKTIEEIKAVIGEPKNVEIVDGSRILTWPGLQLLCTNDKKMVVKEVLQNIYK